MTLELHEEVASYGRQLSSTALLEPRPVHDFITRIERRLRSIYQTITCTRSSDVVLQQPQVRPPRHSTGQQPQVRPPRHSTGQHRHQPRPRVDHQWMSRPPPPDQAGSSAWQHHHDPTSGHGFRPDPQQHGPPPSFVMHQHPTGAYVYRAPMSGHEASHSESTFDSAPDGGHNTQDQVSQHITNWMDTYYSTPPPDPTQPTQPTQDTQYGQDESLIPLRNVRPPNRLGWSTPPPPQPRRGRRGRG